MILGEGRRQYRTECFKIGVVVGRLVAQLSGNKLAFKFLAYGIKEGLSVTLSPEVPERSLKGYQKTKQNRI